MQLKRFFVLSLLFVFVAAVFSFSGVEPIGSAVANGAATNVYYVSPSGNDSNPGTQEKPWKTLAKAGSTAKAGDTVVLMDGEYVGQLAPKNSGTAALPITFKAQNRGKALIKGDTNLKSYGYGNSRLWGIYIEGKSYLNIDGINVEMQDKYYGRWLKIVKDSSGNRSHHINVSNCVMKNATGSDNTMNAYDQTSPVVLAYCDNIRLYGNIISELRRMDDMISIRNATNIVLESNQICKAPHAPLAVEDGSSFYDTVSNLVIRNNVFNSQWGRGYTIFPTENVLIEGNIFSENINGGGSARGGDELFPNQCIYRFNRVMRNSDFGVEVGPWAKNMYIKNVRFYNNVFAETAKSVFVFCEEASLITNNIFKNNIFYNNDNYGDYVNLRYIGNENQVIVQNNLFWHGSGIEPCVTSGTSKKQTISSLQPSKMFSDNIIKNPYFVDAVNYNFSLLDNSPAIDAAQALTTATNSGSASKTLTVADARYFYDGWGIWGETGDVIAVGSASNTARITAVNYSNNTITLDTPLSWAKGAEVNLAYAGSKPDLGMYEMGNTGRVSVQVSTQPFKATVGKPVKLTTVVRGACTPSAYQWNFGDGIVQSGGNSVSHTYSSPGQYAVFCAVTGADGRVYQGCAYVIVQAQDAYAKPLTKCTFDATDLDWEWIINTGVRDSLIEEPVEVQQMFDGSNGYLRLYVNGDRNDLWAEINPNEWNIDKYPIVKADYKIKAGTPVGMFVRAYPTYNWDDNFTKGYRFVFFASTKACGISTPVTLIDDNNWHTIVIDARDIRKTYPNLIFANAVGFKNTGKAAVSGNEWYLDNFSIEPDPNSIPETPPTTPEEPTQPEQPTKPEEPTKPQDPPKTEEPTKPQDPPKTEEPTKPQDPPKSEQPTKPEEPKTPEVPVSGNNLIANPGFDLSSTSPWKVSGSWLSSCYSVVTTNPRSATKCIKLNGQKSRSNLYQTVAVKPNTEYVLSFYGKVGAKNALGYYVCSSDWNTILSPLSYCSASGNWTKYTVTFNSGKYSSILIAFEDYAAATYTGTCISYIDDVELKAVQQQPGQQQPGQQQPGQQQPGQQQPVQQQLVLNPGFDLSSTSPWKVSGGWKSNPRFSIVTDNPYSATKCVKLNGQRSAYDLYQTVAVTPNTNYVFSFYGKVGKDKAIEYYVCTSDWKTVLSPACYCAASSKWTQYTVSFNSGKNTSVLLVIEDYAGAKYSGTCTSYIDDVNLLASSK